MFNTLYLLNYNNYYNRILKHEADLNGYLNFSPVRITGYNFSPNDSVTTTITVNIDDSLSTVDYCVVANEYNNIVSRWFVIEGQRVRGNQYTYTLYRDTVADFFNVIKEAPAFIEKGIVLDDDNFIFNTEDMSFNQIKTKETLLKDKTQHSWLVAYIAKETAIGEEKAITINVTPPGVADITVPTRADFNYNDKIDTTYYGPIDSAKLQVNFRRVLGDTVYFLSPVIQQVTSTAAISSRYLDRTQANYISSPVASEGWDSFYSTYSNTFADVLTEAKKYSVGGNTTSSADIADFLSYNGKTIVFSNESNVIYKIKITSSYTKDTTPTGTISAQDPFYLYLKEKWSGAFITTTNSPFYQISTERQVYTMTLESQGTFSSLQTTLPADRLILSDAPYCMICAPYEDITIKNGTNTYKSTTTNVLAIFNKMIEDGAGGDNPWLYDIQRLPYCPITSFETVNGVLDATNWSNDKQFFKIMKNNTPVGALFACNVSNFSTTIALDEPVIIKNTKIENQCDIYRLCSPNYNGVFEFSAAKNGGFSYFNVDCSYKPYNPYIQIAPNFNRLYGQDFNDARGLICGGEWSMPMLTSAWQTYERQNSNYNSIFNRQVTNMEINNYYASVQDKIGAVVGTLQGTATGSMLGSKFGGTGATIVGGLIGGIASGIAGITDVSINQQLRNEALDYSKDMFGYQLGTIKALPMSLSRVSAFTVNNKIFPFLEYYTCAEEEKLALAQKICYNGMTVMKIGKLADYIERQWGYNDLVSKNYIKAQIIKLDILEDSHVANTIAKEVSLGLYFKEGGN